MEGMKVCLGYKSINSPLTPHPSTAGSTTAEKRIKLFFGKQETLSLQLHHSGDIKQEAHGPHRSPEKTVQINKHMIIS